MIVRQLQGQGVHERYVPLLLTLQVLHCHVILTDPSLQAQIASVQPATGILSDTFQEQIRYYYVHARRNDA